MVCPLCLENKSSLFYAQTKGVNWELYGLTKSTVKDLNFFKCAYCDLIFKDPEILLSAQNEKTRYDLHVNKPSDPAYDEFLNSLVEPILKGLAPQSVGLDFGCGVEPAIQTLVQKKGFPCSSYDPYFHKDLDLLERKYDFITVCETAEHFYQPEKEFKLLFGLLNPQGRIGIRTGHVPQDFSSWWYHRDPTHVVFYSQKTFEWLAMKYDAQLELFPKDVVLLRPFPVLE